MEPKGRVCWNEQFAHGRASGEDTGDEFINASPGSFLQFRRGRGLLLYECFLYISIVIVIVIIFVVIVVMDDVLRFSDAVQRQGTETGVLRFSIKEGTRGAGGEAVTGNLLRVAIHAPMIFELPRRRDTPTCVSCGCVVLELRRRGTGVLEGAAG
jgi:hypothetical protein